MLRPPDPGGRKQLCRCTNIGVASVATSRKCWRERTLLRATPARDVAVAGWRNSSRHLEWVRPGNNPEVPAPPGRVHYHE